MTRVRFLVVGLFLPASCAVGSASSSLAPAPSLEQSGQATCKVKRSHLRPLVVAWASADRAALEARMRDGPIIVRYTGCELDVLPRCRAKHGDYKFVGVTRKTDRISILDEDE